MKLLTSRYKFLLNPHAATRLSKCPKCRKVSYPRKFALLIDVKGWGPMVQGKTCQYCSRCELIMCHQVDLENELALSFAKIGPKLIGNDYIVMGIFDMKLFQAQLKEPTTSGKLVEHFTPFKDHVNMDIDPGGWRSVDAPPQVITASAARERLSTLWKNRD